MATSPVARAAQAWSGPVTVPRVVAVGLATALALALLPAAPAAAMDIDDVRTSGTERVLAGLRQSQVTVTLSNGARARGNMLRLPEGDGQLALRPRAARGTAAGIQRFTDLAATERRRGALAGTNGGYWLPRPTGVPNGLYMQAGRAMAGKPVTGSGLPRLSASGPIARATIGWHGDGSLLMDRLGTELTLSSDRLGGSTTIDEFNRMPRNPAVDGTAAVDGELLLFDRTFGADYIAPAGSTAVVVEDLPIPSRGQVRGTVEDVHRWDHPVSLPAPGGRSVLLAYGDRRDALDGLREGDEVAVDAEVAPLTSDPGQWEGLTNALPGGGLLVRGGQVQSEATWRAETVGDITGRHPRTGVARTGDGTVMLVTIDGCRTYETACDPNWSAGLTMREFAHTLRHLGARDAVNLDGGGSTTMTVDGAVANRPSVTGRSVANGLFVYAPLPSEPRSLDLACPDGFPARGFEDTPGTVHVAEIDCLAWWGVTSGVTPERYDPSGRVTRAQMATFLAGWLDDIAERGNGAALPDQADLTFADVAGTNVHADSIARLNAAGVLTGRSADSFAPGAHVSRAQTATLLRGALEHATGTPLPNVRDTFTDDNGNTHEGSINRLAGLGVTTGTGGFNFSPQNPVTRGAMASLIMRASAELVEEGWVSPPA
jgi:hypothetical protein